MKKNIVSPGGTLDITPPPSGFFSIASTSGLETALTFWKPKSPFLTFLDSEEVHGTR